MDSLAQIMVAVITTLGTIAVAYVGARSGKLGRLTGPRVEDMAALRELVEVEEAKGEVWRHKYESEVEAHVQATLALTAMEERAEYAEREADACSRRLNDVYYELRTTGKVRDRRHELRPEEGSTGRTQEARDDG